MADTAEDIKNVSDRDERLLGSELERIGRERKVQIVFVIIPDSGPTYAKVKQKAEINYGVLTQCIKGGTVFRKRNDASTISNICLKVNAKLNGTNYKLQSSAILSQAPGKVMVIGADVTHPSPEQKTIPRYFSCESISPIQCDNFMYLSIAVLLVFLRLMMQTHFVTTCAGAFKGQKLKSSKISETLWLII